MTQGPFILSCIAFACLCSCGAVGGADVGRGQPAGIFDSYSNDLAGRDASNPALLPMSGSAQYTGAARLNFPVTVASDPVYGAFNMTVSFGGCCGGITGRIDRFEGADQISGQMTIAGGALDPTVDPDDDYTYGATLTGSVTASGATYDVRGRLFGEFVGRDQNGTRGVVTGTLSSAGTQDIFDGRFLGGRQAD